MNPIKCSKCGKLNELADCEIVGESFGQMLVNCVCGGTLSIRGLNLSPKFELLSDLSAGIVGITSYNGAKIALDFISEDLVDPIDIKFSQDLRKRIERLEKRKAA